MGYFANIGALKEGEIILSDDRHHLYQVTEGEFTEYEKIPSEYCRHLDTENELTKCKIHVSPSNPNSWEQEPKRGVSVYDVLKKVIYGYKKIC